MQITYFLPPNTPHEKTERNGIPFIGNTFLCWQDGHLAHKATDRFIDLPPDIASLVVRVVISTPLGIPEWRRPGCYQIGNSNGEVENRYSTSGGHSSVLVTAPTKVEALELYDAILDGTLNPVRDFTAQQVPPVYPNPDRLAALEAQAAELALSMIERAMGRLKGTLLPT